MNVICISGNAGHGKDYTANLLKENLEAKGNSVLIIHYADLLKYVCKTYLGWNGEKDEAGRTMLQQVGTEMVREYDADFWVDFVYCIVYVFKDKWDYAIIPDCRFENEVNTFRDNGWSFNTTYHIKIERPNYDNGLTEEQKKHSSEIDLGEFCAPDFVLKVWNLP